ncbi:unnamed protein product [Urochloa humidicola]
MEALAVGSAPPRPGLAAPTPTRYSHLRRPRTLAAASTASARRPLAAVHMDAAAAGGRPSPAPARCTRAETEPEVGEVATSSHAAAEADAAGATEQGDNGSPVADAAAGAAAAASIEGVDGIRIRRRPVTGPSVHYVGPFQFRLENEGNTPRNILEKIVWDKDVQVSQMKERRPLYMLKGALDAAPPARDFVGALKASYDRTGLPALIAEVKKA